MTFFEQTFARAPKVATLLVFLLLPWSLPVAAADADDLCVQAFLDFKGFDPGPLDGAAGRKTFAAAAEYKAEHQLTIADLGAGNSSEWCVFAKADADYAALLDYSYNTDILWKQGVADRANFDQVLFGSSVGTYERAKRSITNPEALGFVALNNGLSAARVQVRYKDEGHREDWFYNDQSGLQQRFELVEKRNTWMRAGQTYWVRMSIFVPKGTTVANLDQIVISDLKAETNGNIILDPVVTFKLVSLAFALNHFVGPDRTLDCAVVSNKGGGDNTLCNINMEQDEIMSLSGISGKWTNLVYRVHWADDESGRLHVWVNDKLIAGFAGNTSHGGTSFQSKFGAYRGLYGSQPEPQPDVRLYFAGVGRSESCEGLGLSNCAALEADVEKLGRMSMRGFEMVVFDDLTPYLAAGGKVKCDTTGCR